MDYEVPKDSPYKNLTSDEILELLEYDVKEMTKEDVVEIVDWGKVLDETFDKYGDCDNSCNPSSDEILDLFDDDGFLKKDAEGHEADPDHTSEDVNDDDIREAESKDISESNVVDNIISVVDMIIEEKEDSFAHRFMIN